MKEIDLNFVVSSLGECRITSPITGVRFVNDGEHVLYHADLRAIKSYLDAGERASLPGKSRTPGENLLRPRKP